MKYISRKKALKNPIFASFIYGWQQTNNPSESDAKIEGEYYDENTDTFRFFSQNELNEILEKEIVNFKSITDAINRIDINIKGTVVIDAPANVDEIEFLTEVIASFAKAHQIELTFMPLFNLPWFNEKIEGHHPSTKISYSNFKNFIGDKAYNGAIVVSDYSDLKKMLPDYFNLVQSNYYGYNFFYSETLKTVFSFHYTGQIWFYIYAEESMIKIKEFINKNNLIINYRYTTNDV